MKSIKVKKYVLLLNYIFEVNAFSSPSVGLNLNDHKIKNNRFIFSLKLSKFKHDSIDI